MLKNNIFKCLKNTFSLTKRPTGFQPAPLSYRKITDLTDLNYRTILQIFITICENCL